MSVTAHVFPKFLTALSNKQVNFVTSTVDNVGVLLIASTSATYTWNATAEGNEYVSDFLGTGSGSALTEVSTSGTAYSRITNLVPSLSASGAVMTLGLGSNPSWGSSTISAIYAAFYDATPSTDATRPLICYWDFGGTQASSNGTFTLTINGSGLCTWTSN